MGRFGQVQAFNWAPHHVVEARLLQDFASWRSAIEGMANTVDAILVLSYEGLRVSPANFALVPETEIVRWTMSNAKPLPVGFSVSFVVEGGAMGIVPSPLEMGESAADYALSLIKNNSGPAPPITQSTTYRIAIRASELGARNVNLPSIYIEAARMDQLYFP